MPTTLEASICNSVIEAVLRVAALLLAVCIAAPAWGAEFLASVRTPEGAAVADAVVVMVPVGAALPLVTPASDIVDQIDKQFVPYVKPILVGAEVSFPNKDNIRHQVYSFSPAKRFELPLYRESPTQPILFDKSGVVTLGCNIHDWMIGYIYVSDSPWFAKTGDDGTATIELPAGTWRARTWHPQMTGSEEDTVREVVVMESGSAQQEWQLVLRPEQRPRRAPAGRDDSYR